MNNPATDSSETTANHNQRMNRINVARDRMTAGKTQEKGLITVNTGRVGP